MAKWEFKAVRLVVSKADQKLAEAAADGWEIVTAQFVPTGQVVRLFALLRRQPKATRGGSMVTL